MSKEKMPILAAEYSEENARYELIDVVTNELIAIFLSEDSVYTFYKALNIAKASAFAAGRAGI